MWDLLGESWYVSKYDSYSLDESCLTGHFYWLERFEDWSVDPNKFQCPAIGSGKRKGKLFLGGCSETIPHQGTRFEDSEGFGFICERNHGDESHPV